MPGGLESKIMAAWYSFLISHLCISDEIITNIADCHGRTAQNNYLKNWNTV